MWHYQSTAASQMNNVFITGQLFAFFRSHSFLSHLPLSLFIILFFILAIFQMRLRMRCLWPSSTPPATFSRSMKSATTIKEIQIVCETKGSHMGEKPAPVCHLASVHQFCALTLKWCWIILSFPASRREHYDHNNTFKWMNQKALIIFVTPDKG